MIDCRKWLKAINEHWHGFPGHCLAPYPFIMQDFIDEMSWLLHEALPEESFHLGYAKTHTFSHYKGHGWHRDWGMYLRVLFTPQGEGTIAAYGFENNIQTPHGYALVLTGQQRTQAIRIPETWHNGPDAHMNRRLLILNYQNPS